CGLVLDTNLHESIKGKLIDYMIRKNNKNKENRIDSYSEFVFVYTFWIIWSHGDAHSLFQNELVDDNYSRTEKGTSRFDQLGMPTMQMPYLNAPCIISSHNSALLST
ncbi:hypothetical protein ACJX0J_021567, partial [Zea mays]